MLAGVPLAAQRGTPTGPLPRISKLSQRNVPLWQQIKGVIRPKSTKALADYLYQEPNANFTTVQNKFSAVIANEMQKVTSPAVLEKILKRYIDETHGQGNYTPQVIKTIVEINDALDNLPDGATKLSDAAVLAKTEFANQITQMASPLDAIWVATGETVPVPHRALSGRAAAASARATWRASACRWRAHWGTPTDAASCTGTSRPRTCSSPKDAP